MRFFLGDNNRWKKNIEKPNNNNCSRDSHDDENMFFETVKNHKVKDIALDFNCKPHTKQKKKPDTQNLSPDFIGLLQMIGRKRRVVFVR